MADIKGVGVDCAMLLVRVYCDLGLVERFDPRPYTQDWMMHRNEERYLGFLLKRARMVETPGMRRRRPVPHRPLLRPWRNRREAEPLTIIHAFMPAGVVLEDEVARSAELAERLPTAKFASYWA